MEKSGPSACFRTRGARHAGRCDGGVFLSSKPAKHADRKADGRHAGRRLPPGWPVDRLALVFVFFPTNVAHLACPPAGHPMADIGDGMLGSTSHTFGLRRYLD